MFVKFPKNLNPNPYQDAQYCVWNNLRYTGMIGVFNFRLLAHYALPAWTQFIGLELTTTPPPWWLHPTGLDPPWTKARYLISGWTRNFVLENFVNNIMGGSKIRYKNRTIKLWAIFPIVSIRPVLTLSCL